MMNCLMMKQRASGSSQLYSLFSYENKAFNHHVNNYGKYGFLLVS